MFLKSLNVFLGSTLQPRFRWAVRILQFYISGRIINERRSGAGRPHGTLTFRLSVPISHDVKDGFSLFSVIYQSWEAKL